MMRALVIAFATFLVVSMSNVGAVAAGIDGLKISPERWQDEVKTVAIWIEAMPYGGAEGSVLRRVALDRLVERLRSMGITVVPPEVFDATWRGNAADLGGIYSRVDGEPDREKRRLAYEFTVRELAVSRAVDAVVLLSFSENPVETTSGTGNNDAGTLAAVGDYLYWGDFWVKNVFRTRQYPQRVEALWVGVSVLDPAGLSIFGVRCAVNWKRIYMLRSFRDREDANVFVREDIEHAVDRCTEDMQERTEKVSAVRAR